MNRRNFIKTALAGLTAAILPVRATEKALEGPYTVKLPDPLLYTNFEATNAYEVLNRHKELSRLASKVLNTPDRKWFSLDT